MINASRNNNYQIKNSYFIWLFVYLGTGLSIFLILPFPISLGVFLLAFFLLNVIKTEINLRNARVGGIRGLYKSMSSLRSRGFGNLVYPPTRFYCMNCGNEHREVSCPKCGSKMKKVGL